MTRYESEEPVNVGRGEDISIRELATLVREITGFLGQLEFDATKPDGTPRKLLDVSRMTALGWKPRISLQAGIESTYEWFLRAQGTYRA